MASAIFDGYNSFMPYTATAINVMIASPSDVATERNVVRAVVHEWNAIHSRDRSLILTPVGWETHAFPEIGDRPQAVINKQILEQCDLLIAVFWTRIGSPTGEADSGTVEEIERHIKSGKPAMLYFSNVPVRPDSVDEKQYAALRAFRADFQKRGLIDTYSSLEEFREKLSRHLAQTVIRSFGHLSSKGASSTPLPARAARAPQLGETARLLLAEIAQDRSGVLMVVTVANSMANGLIVQTNGKQLTAANDPRSEAKWMGAVKELVSTGLLESQGGKGEIFRLTDRGYTAAEELGAAVSAA